jgi:hypothetical protein
MENNFIGRGNPTFAPWDNFYMTGNSHGKKGYGNFHFNRRKNLRGYKALFCTFDTMEIYIRWMEILPRKTQIP